ncbi:hypothetical protein GXB81_00195 [Paraburkholderia sp. Ac-20336]|uniref:hypothetical protein n=1 Tax=Burkholderiaceae TaxID=119060 RepID=UPI00141F397E|nr:MULTISPECIES: hypothetical protein [Burkholderiaceae]MBN3801481.1 hypothetical protein [Paraburkholderia sp. Ac-20336]MBN3846032.1 hypothetical protein [Paraburkholderia sp. Ac-20342]NIF54174.1 hypothetical protein [Burkholderia sp. Ax-1724]NIF77716.1 hypothetical protein [Paraburkholderia sp. Cy-641]
MRDATKPEPMFSLRAAPGDLSDSHNVDAPRTIFTSAIASAFSSAFSSVAGKTAGPCHSAWRAMQSPPLSALASNGNEHTSVRAVAILGYN